LLPDDQVHPDTHVLTMVNNVIGVVNYVIAARPSLRNFVIADRQSARVAVVAVLARSFRGSADESASALRGSGGIRLWS
jgi:hypothetical protein